MNLPYEKRSSLEDLMRMNEPQTPTVQISEADWIRLSETLRMVEETAEREKAARAAMVAAGEDYLAAMKEAATEQTEAAKKAIREIAEQAGQQVGNASAKCSRAIERRTIREEFLWWFRLLCMALPTVLILLLAAYMGWLPSVR